MVAADFADAGIRFIIRKGYRAEAVSSCTIEIIASFDEDDGDFRLSRPRVEGPRATSHPRIAPTSRCIGNHVTACLGVIAYPFIRFPIASCQSIGGHRIDLVKTIL